MGWRCKCICNGFVWESVLCVVCLSGRWYWNNFWGVGVINSMISTILEISKRRNLWCQQFGNGGKRICTTPEFGDDDASMGGAGSKDPVMVLWKGSLLTIIWLCSNAILRARVNFSSVSTMLSLLVLFPKGWWQIGKFFVPTFYRHSYIPEAINFRE